MNETQNNFIASLIESDCNVSQACKDNDVELTQFHEWMKDDTFREGYDTAIQVRDDQALSAMMILIRQNDRAAVIEYQKMQRQREDLNEIKSTKREVMRVLIESQDTKAACLKEYCQIFKGTKSAAEDQYKNIVTELGLKTPHQRMKDKKFDKDSSMTERFKANNLTEEEMLHCMITQAMYDADNSEYTSERSKARQDVRSLTQDIRELKERIRRDAEVDKTSLPKLLKAFVMSTSAAGIDKLDKGMAQLKAIAYNDQLKAIEVVDD